MSANHFIVPSLPLGTVTTARLGAGNATNQRLTDADAGKLVKLAGESRYDFTAIGDPIEGVIVAVESATSAGYSIGGVVSDKKFYASAEGLQATGASALSIGDYVVAGTQVALNTVMPGYPKVRKATSQAVQLFMWRVVSLGSGGGAVGTTVVVERTV